MMTPEQIASHNQVVASMNKSLGRNLGDIIEIAVQAKATLDTGAALDLNTVNVIMANINRIMVEAAVNGAWLAALK